MEAEFSEHEARDIYDAALFQQELRRLQRKGLLILIPVNTETQRIGPRGIFRDRTVPLGGKAVWTGRGVQFFTHEGSRTLSTRFMHWPYVIEFCNQYNYLSALVREINREP